MKVPGSRFRAVEVWGVGALELGFGFLGSSSGFGVWDCVFVVFGLGFSFFGFRVQLSRPAGLDAHQIRLCLHLWV